MRITFGAGGAADGGRRSALSTSRAARPGGLLSGPCERLLVDEPPREVLLRNAAGFMRASSRCRQVTGVGGKRHVNGNHIGFSERLSKLAASLPELISRST